MATKMARLLTASSLPAAGLFFTSVKAAGKKVHPSELDIYDKPNLVQEVILEEPPSELEKKIAEGRKQVVSYWGSMKDIFGKGQSLAQTATVKSSEFMELISTDQTFQIKVAVISSGVLIGAIAAGRGRRPFRRFFYSAGLGTIAFSACYPKKAWVISQKGYEQSKVLFNKLKTMYNEEKQKRLTEATEEKSQTQEIKSEEFVEEPQELLPVENIAPEPAPKEGIIEEMTDMGTLTSAVNTTDSERSYLSYIPFLGWFFSGKSDKSAEEAQTNVSVDKSDSQSVKPTAVPSDEAKSEKKVGIAGDHGQSNPEDKDMYSTRE